MKDKFEKIKLWLLILFVVCCFWISTTYMVCMFKNPELTQTQVFLRIPKSFVLDFD